MLGSNEREWRELITRIVGIRVVKVKYATNESNKLTYYRIEKLRLNVQLTTLLDVLASL